MVCADQLEKRQVKFSIPTYVDLVLPIIIMDEDKLIKLVRQYDELYNVKNKKYTNTFHRDKIWSIIGQQLNLNGDECKKKWVTLRDQFRKVLKNRIKTGQTAEDTRKWKHEDNMSFIIPFFKVRNNIRISISTGPEFWDNESDAQESKMETIYFDDENNISNDSISVEKTDWSLASLNPSQMETLESSETLKRKRTNYNDDQISYKVEEETDWSQVPPISPKLEESPSFKDEKSVQPQQLNIMNTLDLIETEKCETNVILSSNVHPIDLFFTGLAATVKNFSPEFQHIAKSKVFAVVSDLEWKQMHQQNIDHHDPSFENSTRSQT